MTYIAHLSDLHLLEHNHHSRIGLAKHRLSYLSFGRSLNFNFRKDRTKSCLLEAINKGVDHIVVTGDLTEDGELSQFETLADILHTLKVDPCKITLIPGNHDIYTQPNAWEKALSGPLAKYAQNSRKDSIVVVGDVIIKSVCTLVNQYFTRSSGSINSEDVATITKISKDSSLKNKIIISAQHHAPIKYFNPILNWVDGIKDDRLFQNLLKNIPNLYILHGHVHKLITKYFGRRYPQVFGADAIVCSENSVRYYKTDSSILQEVL